MYEMTDAKKENRRKENKNTKKMVIKTSWKIL